MNWLFIWILVTITTIFTWIKLYTINTFWPKHPKQMFSTSRECLLLHLFVCLQISEHLIWHSDGWLYSYVAWPSLTKYIAPEGWTFAPLSLKVVWGPPFLFHFLGLHNYIELQVYKLLPKSECRFYLGGITLSNIHMLFGSWHPYCKNLYSTVRELHHIARVFASIFFTRKDSLLVSDSFIMS